MPKALSSESPGRLGQKKGGVQNPASWDVTTVREPAPHAGPSRIPTGPRKGGKGPKPASSGAEGGSECECTPRAGRSRTPAYVNQAQFTEALPKIPARKCIKTRKARVKHLTEALAARKECDDPYGATGAPVYIAGNVFDEDPWAQMSDLDASSMGTPPLNSPHVSPNKSRFFF